MFGLKSQASHCLWQLCTHWTHKKPCTWSQWTLPFASESCPAARSTLLGTCPRDLPLENVLPARIYFKLIEGLKLSVLYCLNFTFVTVLPALARPRKSPNEVEPFWPEESKELCDARGWVDCACTTSCIHLDEKELLREKSHCPHVWTRPKFLQPLLVPHLGFRMAENWGEKKTLSLPVYSRTIWLQSLLAVSNGDGSSSCRRCLENNTDRGSEWRRST